MAFTTTGNSYDVYMTDIRDQRRRLTIELDANVLTVEPFAQAISDMSKSEALYFINKNRQLNDTVNPDADSEVRDTLRLYFEMSDGKIAFRDLPDGDDVLFVSTTGDDAFIVRPYADLAADTDPHAVALVFLIDNFLNGQMRISDGEQPVKYLRGRRIT